LSTTENEGITLTDNERIALAVVKKMFEEAEETEVPVRESVAVDTVVESSNMNSEEAVIAIRGLAEKHKFYLGPENTVLPPNVRMTQKAS